VDVVYLHVLIGSSAQVDASRCCWTEVEDKNTSVWVDGRCLANDKSCQL